MELAVVMRTIIDLIRKKNKFILFPEKQYQRIYIFYITLLWKRNSEAETSFHQLIYIIYLDY